jgi:hypothetical protein
MDTAVLERRVSHKTRNRTQGFNELKPQVKVNNISHNEICDDDWSFDDYPESDYELSEEGKKSLERALNDIRTGNVRVLATRKILK